MIRHTKWLAVVAMLLVVSPAFAQPEGGRGGQGRGQQGQGGRFGGGFGGGQTKYNLLGNSAVQEELAITPEQKEKAQKLLSDFREALRGSGGQEDFAALRDLPAEERREKMAEFAKKREETTSKAIAEFKPKFAEVLDEVQLQRLQQIYWQSQGANALRDAELAETLKLSAEQKEKIATASRGAGFGRNRQEGGPSPAEAAAKRNEEILSVLTAEQKAEFEKLKGAAFDVSKLRTGGPGGPGGRREGGDRGPRAQQN
ncbi:hypothetical protein [Planctomicrobium sp. SH527]|uniref:hypothetical protein n=1 Tax=Planctomicrobium sp. SH527 TaxID=3448123 RepID=UPI003F5B68E0